MYANRGVFRTRVKCTGCGKRWSAPNKEAEAKINDHGSTCRRAPNPTVDVKAVIGAAFRM